MAATLRGTGIQASSTNSYTVSWPSGTVAGDRAIINCGHGFAINLPSGWAALDNSTGGNWNGRSFWKDLSSGDISTGHVTVTTTGSFDGAIAVTTIQTGTFDTTIAPFIVPVQNSSGSSTVTVNGLVPTTSDLAIYFSSNRAASTNTCSIGSLQRQANDGSAASAALYTENPGSITPSPVFSYSSAGSGNYQCVVAVMAPLTIPSWLRESHIQASSASSYTVSWPAAVSGDTAVIVISGGFAASSVPTGWTRIDNSTGANWQGSVIWKVLNGTDISNGNVSISMSGTFSSVLGIWVVKSASLSGYANPVATMGVDSGYASTRTVNYTSSHTTDFACSFSSFRTAVCATITDVTGSTIQNQTNDQVAGSGAMYAGSPNSVGTISPVFRFGSGFGGGAGDYEGTILFAGPSSVSVNLVAAAATATVEPLAPSTPVSLVAVAAAGAVESLAINSSSNISLGAAAATAVAEPLVSGVDVNFHLVSVAAIAAVGSFNPVITDNILLVGTQTVAGTGVFAPITQPDCDLLVVGAINPVQVVLGPLDDDPVIALGTLVNSPVIVQAVMCCSC